MVLRAAVRSVQSEQYNQRAESEVIRKLRSDVKLMYVYAGSDDSDATSGAARRSTAFGISGVAFVGPWAKIDNEMTSYSRNDSLASSSLSWRVRLANQ